MLTAYDLLTGRIAGVRVQGEQGAESLVAVALQRGDLVVADTAYCRATSLLAVQAASAQFVVRWTPRFLRLYAAGAPNHLPEHQLAWQSWLASLPVGLHERWVELSQEKQSLAVRLIVLVPPPELAERLREQKRRHARDKGRSLGKEAEFLAGFLLLVSTLPKSTWSTQQILEVYQARWQIEIV